jgi:hypothetical protein
MTDLTASDRPDVSRLEVVHLLLLLQGAMALLSGVAMLLFMGGNPLGMPLTLGVPVLLFVLAAGTVRGWRWARSVTLGVQYLTLLGFVVSALLGMIPALGFSLNLMTLTTNVVLPVSVIRLLRRPKLAADASAALEGVAPAGAQLAA